MAAAEDGVTVLAANFVVIRSGLVKEILPLHVRIIQQSAVEGGLVVGGRIVDLPAAPGECRLVLFLAPQGEVMVPAAEVDFDPQSGHFSATFDRELRDGDNLKVALFCSQGEE